MNDSMCSAVYTARDRHLKKDGAGIRGSMMKSIMDAAFDDARADTDALAAAEGRKRRRGRQRAEEKINAHVPDTEDDEPGAQSGTQPAAIGSSNAVEASAALTQEHAKKLFTWRWNPSRLTGLVDDSKPLSSQGMLADMMKQRGYENRYYQEICRIIERLKLPSNRITKAACEALIKSIQENIKSPDEIAWLCNRWSFAPSSDESKTKTEPGDVKSGGQKRKVAVNGVETKEHHEVVAHKKRRVATESSMPSPPATIVPAVTAPKKAAPKKPIVNGQQQSKSVTGGSATVAVSSTSVPKKSAPKKPIVHGKSEAKTSANGSIATLTAPKKPAPKKPATKSSTAAVAAALQPAPVELTQEHAKKLFTWYWHPRRLSGFISSKRPLESLSADELKQRFYENGFFELVGRQIQGLGLTNKRITKETCDELIDAVNDRIQSIKSEGSAHYSFESMFPDWTWRKVKEGVMPMVYTLIKPTPKEAIPIIINAIAWMCDRWSWTEKPMKKTQKKPVTKGDDGKPEAKTDAANGKSSEKKTSSGPSAEVKGAYIGSIWVDSTNTGIAPTAYRLVGWTTTKAIIEHVPIIHLKQSSAEALGGSNSCRIDTKWLAENPVVEVKKASGRLLLATPHWWMDVDTEDDNNNEKLQMLQLNKYQQAFRQEEAHMNDIMSWYDN